MKLDLASQESMDNPAGYYAEARRNGPVQWSDAQRGWAVISHAEVEAGLRDSELLSADRIGPLQRVAEQRPAAFQRVVDLLSGWMNFRDPPAHTRLREPVKAAFTPRAISQLEGDVRAFITQALDAFDGEIVDLSRAYARPVPAMVIAAVLGVDPAERDRFQKWSDDLSELVFSTTPGKTPEGRVLDAADEFAAFFRAHIETVRREPSDTLLSTIVHRKEDGLSDMELIGACTLILFGGHETTTTLLMNTLATMLERPDLVAWLRANPDEGETAVDEFMRSVGPARALVRKAKVDHNRGGQRIMAGQNLYLCVVAANHDESVFTDPGTIDLERTPNPHLGFGWGLHYCLGASLARMETRIAIELLLDRYREIAPERPVPPPLFSALGVGRRPLWARLTR